MASLLETIRHIFGRLDFALHRHGSPAILDMDIVAGVLIIAAQTSRFVVFFF
jgi:hypothetical protein